RTVRGLAGILLMPFLHANFQHLISNTVPLIVLLMLLAGSHAKPWMIVLEIVLTSGTLLWVFGRPASHIGASGLIFGLIAYLILSGLLQRRPIPIVVAIIVG